MTDGELLQRIADTLKTEIGPAVEGEYPKTQAFMAAVVLQKLGLQLARAADHAQAAAADLDALLTDLPALAGAAPLPAAVADALADLRAARNDAALCRLVEALYGARDALGSGRFEALLNRVRRCLRHDIDRRLEYAA
ncbi:MAG: hypothetical protein AB7O21_02280 [Gammaproteobacteria bacterium]